MTTRIADVIITRNGRVLLVQQRKEKAYGLWSFPGGHIESGETPEAAVRREVSEELGVALLDVRPYKTYPYTSAGEELLFYTFTGSVGEEIILDNDELLAFDWFSLGELEAMQEKLRTPIVLELSRTALL
jgi:8-oxo-dGTP diphosphatase